MTEMTIPNADGHAANTEAGRPRRLTPKRIALAALLLLVGFAAGIYVGLEWIARPYEWLGAVGQSFIAGQYAFSQYREAEYPAAKNALERYLRFLDSAKASTDHWKPGQSPWLDDRGLAWDKTIVLGRLALLAERNGHPDESSAYWSRAEAMAGKAKWKSPNREHIRSLVARFDAEAPVPAITPAGP